MNTFCELLPPTKSEKHAGFDWTPDGGGHDVLQIKNTRVYTTYRVEPFGTDWAGAAFWLVKLTAGSDPTEAAYDVFCDRTGDRHECSCAGFAYSRSGQPRKHIASMLAILQAEWLDAR